MDMEEYQVPRRDTGYQSRPGLASDDEVSAAWQGSPGVGRGRGMARGWSGVVLDGAGLAPFGPPYRATPGHAGLTGVTPQIDQDLRMSCSGNTFKKLLRK